jgi:small subunit ribosomal protein S17
MTSTQETNREIKRTQTGRVVSSKMDKSVTVLLERQIKHALYGKYIKRSTKVLAHDEDNSCGEGDKVMIAECRPLSRSKSWRVVEILERAQ